MKSETVLISFFVDSRKSKGSVYVCVLVCLHVCVRTLAPFSLNGNTLRFSLERGDGDTTTTPFMTLQVPHTKELIFKSASQMANTYYCTHLMG